MLFSACVWRAKMYLKKINAQVISMYFFLSFPMVLWVSQNFSILTSKKHKTCYISKTIFLIFFWPARSKEEEILHRYSLFLHRGFMFLSRYYSRNTKRSASRRARRASLQHRRAAAFIHSFINYLTTARGLVIACRYP